MRHSEISMLVETLEDDALDDLLTVAQREYKTRLDRIIAEAQDRRDAEEIFSNYEESKRTS